jgi:hypothetical protein
MKYEPIIELVSLQSFFQKKELRVVVDNSIQRRYSWDNEDLEDYWSISSYEEPVYLLGEIKLRFQEDFEKGSPDVIYYCSDGQQRLTTTSIMIVALVNFIKNEEAKEHKQFNIQAFYKKFFIYTNYIADDDNDESKLTPSENIIGLYEELRENNFTELDVLLKNKKEPLINAYLFFYDRFREHYDALDGDFNFKVNTIMALVDTILRKARLTVTYIKSNEPDYENFINQDKGKGLRPHDLIKARLRELFKNDPVYTSKVDEFNRMMSELGDASGKPTAQDDFLKYHFQPFIGGNSDKLSNITIVSKLFHSVNGFFYNDELSKEAIFDRLFEDLMINIWVINEDKTKIDERILDRVFVLNDVLKYDLYKCLLIPLIRNYKDDTQFILDILDLIIKFKFWCKILIGTKEARYIYWESSKKANSKTLSISDLKDMLTDELNGSFNTFNSYIDFYENINKTKISSPITRKFIHVSINNHLNKGYEVKHMIKTLMKGVEDEHIIPKKWKKNDDWALFFKYNGITDEEVNSYIQSIGNSAIITPEKNKSIGNKGFGDKKEIYSRTEWVKLTKQLAQLDQFGIEEVKERESSLKNLIIDTFKL